MAYEVECKKCAIRSKTGSQKRGDKLSNYRCKCGGELKRIGWKQLSKERSIEMNRVLTNFWNEV